MNSQSQKAKDFFVELIGNVPPDEWEDRLVEASGRDEELLRRVRALLRAHAEPGSFLEEPAVANQPDQTLDQPITEKPGTQIGPYKLLQQIGEGGMGVVYMAEQKEPVKRRVALKIIKPGMDTRQVIARFEAERQALAMMNHPNIAKVLDAGATESGRPYFVMELVNGLPVTKYCDEQHLTPKERLELFVPICQAVQHAHQKGIIHRDLKPSNILVALYDGQAVPKIIDFGVAKATSQTLTEKTTFTQLGQVVGTPEYMSPEQAERNQLDIDTRSDIYSLGVVLYELLTGETPFDRERLRSAAFDELLRIIREEDPPKPSTRVSSSQSLPAIAANRRIEPAKLGSLIRSELDWIVLKAMEKDRARRYETASKFAEDVQHYLNDEAVVACPPSRAYRFRKFARRNKAVIGTTAFVAASLMAGIIGTSWQAYRATKAEGIAADRLSIVESQKSEIASEKQKAVAEAKRAEQESAIAKAVNDFLNDDLLGMGDAALQVEGGLSPDPNIKLRSLLDRAASNIEGRFSDQVLAEAAIRHTLGESYRAIGAYREAEAQIQRARKLRSQKLGVGAAATLTSSFELARVYASQGRYAVAETLHKETLDIRRRTLGLEHSDTLKSMASLANICSDLGRYAEAETLHQQTLEIRRRTLGAEHSDTLKSMSDLANVLGHLGRFTEAERVYQRALGIEHRSLGNKHPTTLATMHNLATLYDSQGRHAEAESLCQETLEIQRQALGDEHPTTLAGMNNLAVQYLRQDRYADAKKLIMQTFEIQKRTIGDEHPDTLKSMHNLAIVYVGENRYDEAEKLSQQTLEIRRRTLGPDHPDTINNMNILAGVYLEESRYDEADKLNHEILEIRRRTMGNEHPDTLTSMHNLAKVYFLQRRNAEAEKLLQQTLEIYRRTLGEEHPATLAITNDLAFAFSDVGRYEEAEKRYLQALEILQRTQGDIFPTTKLVRKNLASLCENRSWALATSPTLEERDPAEAVRLAQQAVELFPDVANNWDNLGVALCSKQEYERAVDALEKARGMRGGQDEYHQIFLAMAYAKVGRCDDALSEYLQFANWLDAKRRQAEQYRFRNEAEDIIGLDQLTEYFSHRFQQSPFELATVRLYVDLLLRHQRMEDAVKCCQISLEQDGLSDKDRRSACEEIAKVDELFSSLSELRPDDRQLWLARADYLARTNQWAEAAEVYGKIKYTEPRAAALLLSGDEEGYHTFCNEQMASVQQQKTPSTDICQMVAEICSYSGTADFDRDQLLQWAQQAADEKPSSSTLHTLGCVLYRAGEFARAIEVLEQANARPDTVKSNNAFPLALTYHQLGNTAKVQRLYDYGLQEMKRAKPESSSVAGWAAGHWLSVNVWQREAAKTIGEPPLIPPRPEAVDETSRPQVAETEVATTVPTTIGQKE